nr:MAG TPA: hypothetical protein [Caudoviricetes sp.]
MAEPLSRLIKAFLNSNPLNLALLTFFLIPSNKYILDFLKTPSLST